MVPFLAYCEKDPEVAKIKSEKNEILKKLDVLKGRLQKKKNLIEIFQLEGGGHFPIEKKIKKMLL